jgi:hypothetical protein
MIMRVHYKFIRYAGSIPNLCSGIILWLVPYYTIAVLLVDDKNSFRRARNVSKRIQIVYHTREI